MTTRTAESHAISIHPQPGPFQYEGYEIRREAGLVALHYGFAGGPRFTETIDFGLAIPALSPADAEGLEAAVRALFVLAGVSYYKLFAPDVLDLCELPLSQDQVDFFARTLRHGLGEFAHRNALSLDGRLRFTGGGAPRTHTGPQDASVIDPARAAVLIGGGKDSLVSLEAMRHAGADFRLLAVNPRKPMIDCAAAAGVPLIGITRTLDPLLMEWNGRPGTYNGHVPITAIVSLIAAAAAFVHGFGRIVLSNERSADEPNLVGVDGEPVNHQYSKTSAFEREIADYLTRHVSPRLNYFSLLRPLSELHIAHLFAREDRYDRLFTSCNKAFRLAGRLDALWCGDCAKCRFTFLMLATAMPRERLLNIFPANLLDDPAQIAGYEDLTGLARHKPWDCVGEELESASALARLGDDPDWREAAVIRALAPRLAAGRAALDAAWRAFFTPHWGAPLPAREKELLRDFLG